MIAIGNDTGVRAGHRAWRLRARAHGVAAGSLRCRGESRLESEVKTRQRLFITGIAMPRGNHDAEALDQPDDFRLLHFRRQRDHIDGTATVFEQFGYLFQTG